MLILTKRASLNVYSLSKALRLWQVCTILLFAAVSSTQAQTTTFYYTGSPQTFTVPADVTSLHVVAYGARGAGGSKKGGKVEADLSVTPGETLIIFVGGAGSASTGGYNGGGSGGYNNFLNDGGYGGGGATDIRIGNAGLADRILVAGGSGGNGGLTQDTRIGGAGGGKEAEAGQSYSNAQEGGGGGSANQGGAGGYGSEISGTDGKLGQGGNGGGSVDTLGSGGGGGGGYYGGGGGGSGDGSGKVGEYGGGGGGSSYTNSTRCSNVVHTQDSNIGDNGILTLTYGTRAQIQEQTTTFKSTGETQTFTVPAGVTSLHVVAYGARGGTNSGGISGYGGKVEADLSVTPGQTFTIVVGGAGSIDGTGGYNGGGGGGGGDGENGGGEVTGGGGGGGATDIRIGNAGLADRILVAGGGGGGGGHHRYYGVDGGGGIGDDGDDGDDGQGGGSNTQKDNVFEAYGGSGGDLVAEAGQNDQDTHGGGGGGTYGGSGGSGNLDYGRSGNLGEGGYGGGFSAPNGGDPDSGGGGGGGGYYGGGGGGSGMISHSLIETKITFHAGGGGGGSSYTDAKWCTNVVHTRGNNAGNGELTITYTAPSACTFSNIMVSGFGNSLNGIYSPNGTANGAPKWKQNIYDILWTGTRWEILENGTIYVNGSFYPNNTIYAYNTTGSITNLPCTGWSNSNVTLSGGCGNIAPIFTPSVDITANQSSPITFSTSMTFTATPTNGGTTPSYQWKKNNINVGKNEATYTDANWANGDIISCVMTSNLPCAITATATSNAITVTTSCGAMVNPINDLSVNKGSTTKEIELSGTANTYTWTNNNPAIGLGASGIGNIPKFTATNTSAATILGKIEVTPANAATIYVVNHQGNSVTAVNSVTKAVVATIPVGEDPRFAVITPDEGKIYVVNTDSNSVSVINTSTNTVDKTIKVGKQPVNLKLNPSGTKLYVVNFKDSTVSVINTSTNSVETTFHTNDGPTSISFTPNGTRAYVSNSLSNNITVINTTDNSTIATIPVETYPNCIEVSPDGTKAIAVNQNSNSLSIIDISTNTVTKTLNIGYFPREVIFNRSGSFAYLLNSGTTTVRTKTVSVIKMADNSLSASITVGNNPYGAVLSKDGSRLYVSNKGSNTVSVINTETHEVIETLNSFNEPWGIVAKGHHCIGTPTSFTISSVPLSLFYPKNLTVPNGFFLSSEGIYNKFFINPYPSRGSSHEASRIFDDNIDDYIYTWTNDNPAIGLGASGIDSIPSFIATNTSTDTIIGKIEVTKTKAATIYVVNQNSNSVTALNSVTKAVVATILVGNGPRAAVITPDGETVYVANTAGNSISVINTSTNTVTNTINVDTPVNVSLNPSGTKLYVVNFNAWTVTVINTSTNTVETTFGTNNRPTSISFTPDGTTAYVSNSHSDNISVVNTTDNSTTATIAVGAYPSSIAVSPDGTKAIAVNSNSNSLSVINTATNAVTATLNIGTSPREAIFNLTGTFAYLLNSGTNTVSVINMADNSLSATITVGNNPLGGVLSKDGTRLYVSNSGSNTVSIINTATNTVIETLNSFNFPYGTAIKGNHTISASTSFTISVVLYISPTVNPIPNQRVNKGASTTAVVPTGTATIYTWTNNNPAIGLGASGTDSIPSFIATNTSTDTIIGKIEVTPANATTIYVVNQNDNSVTALNSVTKAIVATIPVGNGPRAALITPDGETVYVANTAGNSISVISTSTNTVTKTINVDTPVNVSLNPSGTKLYVVNFNAWTVTVINTSTNTVETTFGTNNRPTSISFTPNGTTAYVSNSHSDNISVVNTTDNATTATIGVGAYPNCIAVSPDGTKAIAVNTNSNSLSIINTATNAVTTTLNIGNSPREVIFNLTGTFAYLLNSGTNTVSVINMADNSLSATITVGNNPLSGVLSKDGTRLYVSNSGSNTVSIINTATNTVIETLNSFNFPYGTAINGNHTIGTPTSFTISVAPCSSPTAYNVTGGGTDCTGGSGVAIGLANSENNVTYQLKMDNIDNGAPVTGTGSAIFFGNKTLAGTYTVVASKINGGCTATMTDSAVIIISATITSYTVTGGGVLCAGDDGGLPIGLSNSILGVSYQLKKNGNNLGNPIAGTGEVLALGNFFDAGTYTVIATNEQGCTATMTGNVVITLSTLSESYTVTGGGTYCAGTDGVVVGLSGSQTGVSYQLKKGNANIGTPIIGTGAAIGFGKQKTAGTYTVKAYLLGGACMTIFPNSVVVSVDETLPAFVTATVPANITLNCTDAIPAAATLSVTNSCSTVAMTEVSTKGADSLQCSFYSYTITRTWTATDKRGNTATVSQVITVQDNIAPTIAPLANITVTEGTIPKTIANTDNCMASPNVTFTETKVTHTPPPCKNYSYTLNRTWNVTDACGNSSTATQIIKAEGINLTCPSDKTINTNSDGVNNYNCSSLATAAMGVAPSFTDGCDAAVLRYTITGATTGTGNGSVAGIAFAKGVSTITYNLLSNVSDQCSLNLTVLDNEAPKITLTPTIVLDACTMPNPIPDTYKPTVSDNCTGTNTLEVISDVLVDQTGCNTKPAAQKYTKLLTRTWKATDENGYTATATQRIYLRDIVPPITVCKNVTVSIGSANMALPASSLNDGSNDNCSAANALTFVGCINTTTTCTSFTPNIVLKNSMIPKPQSQTTITVLVKAKDACGNETATPVSTIITLKQIGAMNNTTNGSENSMATQDTEADIPAEASTTPTVQGEMKCFPTPFSEDLNIQYNLTENVAMVTLKVYDNQGRLVKTMEQLEQEAGFYQVRWNLSDLASGMYHVCLELNGKCTKMERVIMMK